MVWGGPLADCSDGRAEPSRWEEWCKERRVVKSEETKLLSLKSTFPSPDLLSSADGIVPWAVLWSWHPFLDNFFSSHTASHTTRETTTTKIEFT
jgi:hypothetical protein